MISFKLREFGKQLCFLFCVPNPLLIFCSLFPYSQSETFIIYSPTKHILSYSSPFFFQLLLTSSRSILSLISDFNLNPSQLFIIELSSSPPPTASMIFVSLADVVPSYEGKHRKFFGNIEIVRCGALSNNKILYIQLFPSPRPFSYHFYRFLMPSKPPICLSSRAKLLFFFFLSFFPVMFCFLCFSRMQKEQKQKDSRFSGVGVEVTVAVDFCKHTFTNRDTLATVISLFIFEFRNSPFLVLCRCQNYRDSSPDHSIPCPFSINISYSS